MREIKFRAWDTHFKKWLTIDATFLDLNGILYEYDYDMGISEIFEDNIELNQYTGLKDKNGKEIYENDIVINDFGRELFKVIYSQEKAMFLLTGLKKIDVRTFENPINPSINNTCINLEIIGNIYENPKLLEEK